jgi:hypothetical protein
MTTASGKASNATTKNIGPIVRLARYNRGEIFMAGVGSTTFNCDKSLWDRANILIATAVTNKLLFGEYNGVDLRELSVNSETEVSKCLFRGIYDFTDSAVLVRIREVRFTSYRRLTGSEDFVLIKKKGGIVTVREVNSANIEWIAEDCTKLGRIINALSLAKRSQYVLSI